MQVSQIKDEKVWKNEGHKNVTEIHVQYAFQAIGQLSYRKVTFKQKSAMTRLPACAAKKCGKL